MIYMEIYYKKVTNTSSGEWEVARGGRPRGLQVWRGTAGGESEARDGGVTEETELMVGVEGMAWHFGGNASHKSCFIFSTNFVF